jgi:hypothetical protein
MTHDEAIENLKERGWCFEHTHPYSGGVDQVIVGPRLKSEAYGPFPNGFVTAQMGIGENLIQAMEIALKLEGK